MAESNLALSRRSFLAATGAAGLSALAAPLRGADDDRPLFRFVQLNDVHLAHDDRTYFKAREKFESIVAVLAANPPDLVLAVGDLAHGGAPEKLRPDNLDAAAQLRRLGVPVLPTPGNHEVLQGEGVAELEQAYAEALGHDLRTYAVVFRGVVFLMIDDAGGRAAGDPVADARNELVGQLLADTGELPVIVATHIPLVPFRDPDVLAASFGFSTWKLLGEGGLLGILGQHRERVLAVLNGHLHLTGHVVVDGIDHISISGTASYPCHWAEYTVYRDRVHAQVHQPPAELIGEPGGIHSRTGVRYTDHDHPTYEEYAAGRADEQVFDLSLTGKVPLAPTETLVALKANGFPAPNLWTAPTAPTSTRVENLGRAERVACLPFKARPAGEVYVVSGNHSQLHLGPTGHETWTPDELSAGVPVLLPARGTVTIEALRDRPEGDLERIDTGALLDRERRDSLVPMPPRVGAQLWTDRDYLIDALPDALLDLQPATKPCHRQQATVKVDQPSRVYAVFLPYLGVTPTREEVAALGWTLYRERAFNGQPYPRNQAGGEAGFDIYVRDLEPGETVLSGPRPDEQSAWAILGLEPR